MTRQRIHELYDQQHLAECQRETGLPPDAPVTEVVIALVDQGRCQQAVELLFGLPEELASELMTTPTHNVYLALREGKHPELIKEIARIHHWGAKGSSENFTLQVFLHERLLIPKEIASPALRDFLESHLLAEESERCF